MVILDKIDRKILEFLIEDGRASFSKIAKETKLTDVAIKKRIERLKMKGIIKGISAKINLKSLGYENPIFILLRTELSKSKDVIRKLQQNDYVIELYQVLGEYNLLAKVVLPNLEQAEKFIEKIGLIDGVIDAKTQVILSEVKNRISLPSQVFQKRL